MMAYAHQRSYDSSYTLSDVSGHSLFPTGCTALQPRHSQAASDMEDESGTSASSEEEEEAEGIDSEEEMVLDEVIHLQHHSHPPLELYDDQDVQSRSRYDASSQRSQEQVQQHADHSERRTQTQTVLSHHQQQQQQPPIVVTYGPFHSPDVDVAVAYGQMVCYLWFWQPSSSTNSSDNFDANALALQLQPAPHFIQFLSRVITQTQLSKTVLVLALHYLWLLKRPVMVAAGGEEESEVLDGEMGPVNRPSKLATNKVGNGSQYTVAIIALMLANKFMDDNTYTNKSWASICGVTLEKINSMEREFLIAINHSLHVDVNRFMSWIRIMQSFFTQRQSRFNLRNRRLARPPHPQLHALAPRSLPVPHSLSASPSQYEHAIQQARSYSYQRQGGGSGLRPPIVYRNRAQSRPRQSANATRTGMPAYHSDNDAPRPRSASPHVFQFTFVPPSNPNERERTENNRNELEKGAHGGMMVARQNPGTTTAGETRPFTGHGEFSNGIGSYAYASQPLQQERPRPVTSHPIGMSSMETSINHSNNSTNRTHPSHPHLHLDTTTAAPVTQSRSSTAANALVEPSPILVSSSSRAPAKRSASQAFSPRTVEPPRPHPEERTHDPVHLVHPHPVRHARPAFMYNHASGSNPHLRQPHLTAHPGYHAQRRMNEVHGILASNERSRPNTAVEAGFASMSLAPSGVEERSYPDPAQQRNAIALAQLAASYDPYTAPSFRNEGSRDDEPLRLQFYQLVQGGRGVLRCQPNVDAEGEVPSQRGAPETERRYPPSLSSSTPTDDEEGMSSSESSNGNGWEYQQYSAHPQPQRYMPPQSSWVPQVSVGGGYPLPPLSVVLGDSQARFASPISSISAPNHHLQPVHTPFHDLKYSMPLHRTPSHGVKYAEFANAGPPASYAPQWGLFNSPMTRQYNAQYNGSFQSPASAEGLVESHSHLRPVPAQHHHQAGHGARLSYHGH